MPTALNPNHLFSVLQATRQIQALDDPREIRYQAYVSMAATMAALQANPTYFYGLLKWNQDHHKLQLFVYAHQHYFDVPEEYTPYIGKLVIAQSISLDPLQVCIVQAWPTPVPPPSFIGVVTFIKANQFGVKSAEGIFTPARRQDADLQGYLRSLLGVQVLTYMDKYLHVSDVAPCYPNFPPVHHSGYLYMENRINYISDTTRRVRIRLGEKAASRLGQYYILGQIAPWTEVRYLEFNHAGQTFADYLSINSNPRSFQVTGQLMLAFFHRGARAGLQLRVPFITPAGEQVARNAGNDFQSLHVNYAFPDEVLRFTRADLSQLAENKTWITVSISRNNTVESLFIHGPLPVAQRQVLYSPEVLQQVEKQSVLWV